MTTTDRTPFRARSGRRALRALLALAALVLSAPAPARAQSGADTLNLWWTAPGDDGYAGVVNRYEIRWSTTPITPLNFGTANLASSPSPLGGGQRQHAVVRGLTRGTPYWFAVRAFDEVGNVSDLSNVAYYDWPFDATPPAAPEGVTATPLEDGARILLRWEPGADPDLDGYAVYRSGAPGGPWTKVNRSDIKDPDYLDDSVPAALDRPWYQIAARDYAGNESARSMAVSVPRSALLRQGFRWLLQTGYPNPARVGQMQHIPITLPAGARDAALTIVDNAGQRVRHFDVRAQGPGITEVHWDGTNEAGSPCAPGLYRAWLDADGGRQVVRLVRVP